MRNVFCAVKEEAKYLKILSNNRCALLPQIKKIQQCIIKPCYTQWIALSWQPCSVTCGTGKRLRKVKCYADSEEDKTGKLCDPDTKPHTEDVCNLVDCADGSNQPVLQTTNTANVAQKGPTSSSIRKPLGPSLYPNTPIPTPDIPTRPLVLPRTVSTQEARTTRGPTRAPTRGTRPTQPLLRTTQAPQVTPEPTREATRRPGRLFTILFPTAQNSDDRDVHGMSKGAEIIQGPENMETIVGSDINMPCVATGNPKPDIFWLKGNLDVSVFGRRFQVLPNGSLSIIQVQEVDEDIYTCVANNAISRRSRPAYLSIQTKPYVEISLGYTVKQGEPASIQCKVSGKPKPTVQWYKNGQPLALQRNARMSVTSREINIKSTILEDHGNYDCKATNKNGIKFAHMMLDVMPDEKTRLHDILNGNCKDSHKLEYCAMVGKISGYCDKPYYQKVCCITCREKNKLLQGRLEGA